MKINADFDRRVRVDSETLAWVPSPMTGVSRRMLDRIGGEVARATSIVRYQAGSRFPAHVHGGGEEFLVLDGVFQDEHGDYPSGTYVRNPIDTRHTPASAPGCEIFVKLWQFDAAEKDILRIDTHALRLTPDRARPGVAGAMLYQDARETVRIETWRPHQDIVLGDDGGLELLVLEGGFEADGETCRERAWLRLPRGDRLSVRAGPRGARLWQKTGHLRFVNRPADG